MSRPEEQLPPGQYWGKKWIIYAALDIPTIRAEDWRLRVTGLVENTLEYSYRDFLSLPMLKYTKSFNCIPRGGLVYGNPEPVEIQTLQPGDRVVGGDGKKHAIKQIIRKKYLGDLISLKASYLPVATMTPDHPVLAVKAHPGSGRYRSKRRQKTFRHEAERAWLRADKLAVGDYVFFPKYRHVSSTKYVRWNTSRFRIDQDLGHLLGWYVAEGSPANSSGGCVAFPLEAQTAEATRLRTLLEKLFGAKTSIYTNEGRTTLNVVVTSSRIKDIVAMFKAWCGTDAMSKKIPQFVMDAELGVLRAFLRGYFQGDGYSPALTHEVNRYEDFIDLTTSSRTLAYQLILAFSKLEIPADVVNHPGSVRDGYSVRVRGAKARQIFPGLPIFDKIDKFHYWETADGFYYPITRISKEQYSGEVFDFVAPGFTMLSPFVTQDCVTKWSIRNPEWEGVQLKLLADRARVKSGAAWVMFHCADGYTAPVPIEDALHQDSMVALKLDGKPLKTEQGFPARPFIPRLYGWKSAKWLNEIEFIPEYRDGYWEMYGYHERANVAEEERFKGGEGKHAKRRSFGVV